MLFTLLHYIIILIFIATQLRTNVSNFFSGTELSRQLDRWLGAADLSHGPARAIIAP